MPSSLLHGTSAVAAWLLIFLAALWVGDRAVGLLGFALPRYVHPPHFTQERAHLEFRYTFSTNAQGLRYRDLPLAKANSDERRVLVLGDSFVEGWGVAFDEMFTSRLEAQFEAAEAPTYFINAGLVGTGPSRHLGMLDRFGPAYDIDAALICIYANDVQDMPADPDFTPAQTKDKHPRMAGGRLRSWFPNISALVTVPTERRNRIDAPDLDLVERVRTQARASGIPEEEVQAWADRVGPELIGAADDNRFNGGILTRGFLQPTYWTQALDLDTDRSAQQAQNMQRVLDTMVDRARTQGWALSVAFLPVAFQYNPDAHGATNPWVRAGATIRAAWLTDTTAVQRELAAWADRQGVPFLDLTPAFREVEKAYEEDLHFPLDGHWTPLGHRVAAEALAVWIEEAGWLERRGK